MQTLFVPVRAIHPYLNMKLKPGRWLLLYVQELPVDTLVDGHQSIRYLATMGGVPGTGAGPTPGQAIDMLIYYLRDLLLDLHATRETLAPNVYDVYRHLTSYLEIR